MLNPEMSYVYLKSHGMFFNMIINAKKLKLT